MKFSSRANVIKKKLGTFLHINWVDKKVFFNLNNNRKKPEIPKKRINLKHLSDCVLYYNLVARSNERTKQQQSYENVISFFFLMNQIFALKLKRNFFLLFSLSFAILGLIVLITSK